MNAFTKSTFDRFYQANPHATRKALENVSRPSPVNLDPESLDAGSGDGFGEEIAAWLQEIGFRNSKLIPLPTHLALVVADKLP